MAIDSEQKCREERSNGKVTRMLGDGQTTLRVTKAAKSEEQSYCFSFPPGQSLADVHHLDISSGSSIARETSSLL